MKIYAECHAYFIDLEIKSMELYYCYGVISSFGDISKRQVVYLYTVLTRLITPACSRLQVQHVQGWQDIRILVAYAFVNHNDWAFNFNCQSNPRLLGP